MADLTFDPNDVDDGLAECWITQGPRAADPEFDPQPGDPVMMVDEDGQSLAGWVSIRAGDRVWVQVQIPAPGVPLDDVIADLGFHPSEFE